MHFNPQTQIELRLKNSKFYEKKESKQQQTLLKRK